MGRKGLEVGFFPHTPNLKEIKTRYLSSLNNISIMDYNEMEAMY